MRCITTAAAPALLAAALIAGCGTSSDDTPEPGRQPVSLPHSGAPRVPSPLDPADLLADPCSMLQTADMKAIGAPGAKGKPGNRLPGPNCTFSREGHLLWSLSITFITADKEGLSRTYENNEIDPNDYFEPVDSVSGYPGVFTGLIDDRSEGNCELLVGIRDDLVVQFALFDDVKGDSCQTVKKAAERSLAVG